jgi:hypothetical protein
LRIDRSEFPVIVLAGFLTPVAAVSARWLTLDRTARIMAGKSPKRVSLKRGPESPERLAVIVSGVTSCARCSCLTKGLVLFAVLCRHGYEPELVIGARKQGGRFEAHAWVRCGSAVLIGGGELDSYTPIFSRQAGLISHEMIA